VVETLLRSEGSLGDVREVSEFAEPMLMTVSAVSDLLSSSYLVCCGFFSKQA